MREGQRWGATITARRFFMGGAQTATSPASRKDSSRPGCGKGWGLLCALRGGWSLHPGCPERGRRGPGIGHDQRRQPATWGTVCSCRGAPSILDLNRYKPDGPPTSNTRSLFPSRALAGLTRPLAKPASLPHSSSKGPQGDADTTVGGHFQMQNIPPAGLQGAWARTSDGRAHGVKNP